MAQGRLHLLGLLALGAGATNAAAAAPIRMLVVSSEDAVSYRQAHQGFVEELRARGRIVETRRVLARDFVDEAQSDLVLGLGGAASSRLTALKVPAVFAVVGDPIDSGLCDEASRPRGAITGVGALVAPELQLELVRELLPGDRRIGLIYNPSRASQLYARYAVEARALGLIPVPVAARSAHEVPQVLSAARDHVDVLIALPEPSIWNAASLKTSVMFSLRERKPLIGFSKLFTRGGAIASLAAEDYRAMGAQAARLALRLLQGEDVSSIRVEPAGTISLSLNLVVAGRLGIRVSTDLIERAEDVYR